MAKVRLRGERKQDALLSGEFKLCGVAAAVIGSAALSAGVSAYSSSKASGAQKDAAKSTQDTQLQMYDQTRADQAPYRQAGANALSSLSSGMADGTFKNPIDPTYAPTDFQFTNADLKAGLAPNYDFMLNQGLGAVKNQASLSGGQIGGNALKGINDYAQGYAQNGYQQAYNNAFQTHQQNYANDFQSHQQSFDNVNTNQTNIYNRLANIAGLGQTSNGQTAQVGMNAAGNIGSAQLASGAAQAAGYTGVGNAISGVGSSVSSMYALNNLTGGGIFGNAAPKVGSSASYANNDFLTE